MKRFILESCPFRRGIKVVRRISPSHSDTYICAFTVLAPSHGIIPSYIQALSTDPATKNVVTCDQLLQRNYADSEPEPRSN